MKALLIGIVLFVLAACTTTAPAPKTDAEILENFWAEMSHALDSAKRYPPIAVQAHEQGQVTVSFDYSDSGKISNIHVDQSSGFRSLDMGGISAVLNANFPMKPPQLHEKNHFMFTIVFQIGNHH